MAGGWKASEAAAATGQRSIVAHKNKMFSGALLYVSRDSLVLPCVCSAPIPLYRMIVRRRREKCLVQVVSYSYEYCFVTSDENVKMLEFITRVRVDLECLNARLLVL